MVSLDKTHEDITCGVLVPFHFKVIHSKIQSYDFQLIGMCDHLEAWPHSKTWKEVKLYN